MTDLGDPRLSAWQNFYVIVGSSGAALIGAAALGLLLVGIHNAWDSVTHVVVAARGDSPAGGDSTTAERHLQEAK